MMGTLWFANLYVNALGLTLLFAIPIVGIVAGDIGTRNDGQWAKRAIGVTLSSLALLGYVPLIVGAIFRALISRW